MPTPRLVPSPGGPRLLRGWLERHQHPFSFYLHLAGIPMTLVAVPHLLRRRWGRAVGLFGGGYTLQFLGHLIEGNPPGEVTVLRRPLIRLADRLRGPGRCRGRSACGIPSG